MKTSLLLLFLFLTALQASPPFDYNRFETTSKMRAETKYVVQCVEDVHILQSRIEELNGQQFLKTFLDNLDYSHLYFLQEEVDQLSLRFQHTVSYYLNQGNLYPAFEIFKTYHSNTLKRIDWVYQELDKDFDFLSSRSYAPDRSEEPWPSSQEQADQLWRDRLTYELLNEVLRLEFPSDNEDSEASEDNDSVDTNQKTTSTPSEKQQEASESQEEYQAGISVASVNEAKDTIRRRYKRWQERLLEMEPEDIQEIYLTSLANMYDPHSAFMSSHTLEDFNIHMRNSLVGIGAMLQDEDGYCVIKRLIGGGPAKLSGELQPEDRIVGVGQGEFGEMEDVVDMKLRNVVQLIRGNKGSIVRLLINPGDAEDPSIRKEVSLLRDEIKLTANLASARIYNIPQGDKTLPIGVINLPSFYAEEGGSNTTDDVEELINKLKKEKIEGIVLDLRNNGGGFLTEAVRLTGLFIPTGNVVRVKDTHGKIISKADEDPKIAWNGPLILLTSRNSASASEIIAGALQNYSRALIVGDTATHGKGTVQAVMPMNQMNGFLSRFTQSKPEYGATKITIQKFYLPDGDSTQNQGVTADISLPSINELLPIGESDLDNALSWDSIDPIDLSQQQAILPLNHQLIAQLNQNSQIRRQELEEFSFLQQRIDWWKEKDEQKTISLNFEQRKQQKTKDQQLKKEMDLIEEKLAAFDFAYEPVVLDVVTEKEKEEEAESEEEENTFIDIPLRESLRVMSDWVLAQTQPSANTAAIPTTKEVSPQL